MNFGITVSNWHPLVKSIPILEKPWAEAPGSPKLTGPKTGTDRRRRDRRFWLRKQRDSCSDLSTRGRALDTPPAALGA